MQPLALEWVTTLERYWREAGHPTYECQLSSSGNSTCLRLPLVSDYQLRLPTKALTYVPVSHVLPRLSQLPVNPSQRGGKLIVLVS